MFRQVTPSPRVIAVFVMAALALSGVACGSTVQVDGGAGAPPDGAVANPFPEGGGSGGLTLTPPESAPPPSEATSSRLGSAAPTSGSAASSAALSGDGAAASQARLDAERQSATPSARQRAPVQVGVYVLEGYESFAASAGYNLTVGDGRRQAQAIIDDLNARGGLGGHPIEPVFAAENAQDPASYHTQDQAACATWTQDNDVVAVVSGVNTTDVLPRCLSNQRVPLIAANLSAYAAQQFVEAPFLFAPAMLNQARMAPVYVDRLAAQGFFTPEAPNAEAIIGLLRFDRRDHERVAREHLEPALARHGLTITAEAAVRKAQASSELGAMVAAMQNAQLRFRAEGVTHVLMLDDGAAFGIYFLAAAENNGYRPRYGLTSYSAPYLIAGVVPQAQLEKAMGIGWVLQYDVGPRQRPPASPQEERCRAIAHAAGENTDDALTYAAIANYCETLFLLNFAANRADTITGSGLHDALDRLESAYRPVQTFATRLAPGQHDGVSHTRDLRWDGRCACFVYTSEPTGL